MKNRQSGIECIKVLAILMIVISHVAQTIINKPVYLPSLSSALLITETATNSLSNLALVLFTYLGYLGVDIFVIASSWYLCDNSNVSLKKIIRMLMDVFVISIMFLVIYLLTYHTLPLSLVVKSCMPTFFFNNWFITCYLLFYAVHPLLNMILQNISQEQHKRLCFALIILYVICNFLLSGKFYSNEFVDFILMYFCTAYIKKFSGGGYTCRLLENFYM